MSLTPHLLIETLNKKDSSATIFLKLTVIPYKGKRTWEGFVRLQRSLCQRKPKEEKLEGRRGRGFSDTKQNGPLSVSEQLS